MYGIFITNDNIVLRAASLFDMDTFVQRGWRQLSASEIAAAGMTGYEHLINPVNTVANADGSITFTPPTPLSNEDLFESLRIATQQRLTETDQYGMDDYPDNEKRAAYRLYRTALRELNRQEGAPWDGGGELTPWPVFPLEDKNEA